MTQIRVFDPARYTDEQLKFYGVRLNDIDKDVNAILLENNIQYTAVYTGYGEDNGWKYDNWMVSFNGQSFEYHTGIGHRTKNKFGTEYAVMPSAASVLYCLMSDANLATDTFEDFCSDLGYDTDSRKALDCYLKCQENGTKLHKAIKADVWQRLETALENY